MNTRIGMYCPHRLNAVARLAFAVASASAALIAFESALFAQSSTDGGQANFEVASIKRSGPASRGTLDYSPSGRFTATGLTLKRVIMWAYNLGGPAILGGPGWVDSDKYDIFAEAPQGSITGPVGTGMQLGGDNSRGMGWVLASDTPGGRQLRGMVQALLADRFQLKVHYEPKQLPVYKLVVSKNGPKVQISHAETGPRVSFTMGQLTFQNAPLTFLVTLLTELSGRPVVNATELTGQYDFSLAWTPDQNFRRPDVSNEAAAQADLSGAPLFTALQEQLGLKLEPAKGSVQILVIDRVERPSDN